MLSEIILCQLLLLSLITCDDFMESYPSPEGYYHGKSHEYFKAIQNLPDDSLKDRFIEQYNKITNPSNGYFSKDKIPYYSIETLIVDYMDYGHESTAFTFAQYIYLTALNIWISNDTQPFINAWDTFEKYMIPSIQNQPTNNQYNSSIPAVYTPPNPTNCDTADTNYQSSIVSVGIDPLNDELAEVYGNNGNINQIYLSHYLIDVDNINRFGYNQYIESYKSDDINQTIWRTYDLPSYNTSTNDWNYQNNPVAESLIILATYWANKFTSNINKDITSIIQKTIKLSDFLRYSMYDEYHKIIPCHSINCPSSNSDNSIHLNSTFDLLSEFFVWGQTTENKQNPTKHDRQSQNGIKGSKYFYRKSSSAIHEGYQNPMIAYILSSISSFESKTKNGKQQWLQTMHKTIELFQYLQSNISLISGGVTNSYPNNGCYKNPNAINSTFYGLTYLSNPGGYGYPTNDWFGFNVMSQLNNAQYYYTTNDSKSKYILDKFCNWIQSINNTILLPNDDYQIPSKLKWIGEPNVNLIVTVTEYTKSIGITSMLAHLLTFYSATSRNNDAKQLARELLDRMYLYADNIGVGVKETRQDYIGNEYGQGFWEPIYIPDNPGYTFIDLHSWYLNDPSWPIVQQSKNNAIAPTFIYHRTWEQIQYAIACADYSRFFGTKSN